jgi:thiosulfate/3-mercaptopyruvate sulfurtransferase
MTTRLAAAALAACLSLSARPAIAQTGNASTRAKLVVSPAWLAEHLHESDLVVLQVGRKETYDAGHIPGARLIDYDKGDLHQHHSAGGLDLEMLPAESLRAQLAALGISDASRIVVVAADNYWSPSTRVLLTLDYAGLSNVTWMDGGVQGWIDNGRKLSTDIPAVKPGTLAPLKLRPVVVDAEFVRAHLKTPGFAIVDARTRDFYDGKRIPGAGSTPYNKLAIGKANGTTLRSTEEIESMLRAGGVKPGDTVIGYCHVGQQATALLFVARMLGHNVLLYDGSFTDWEKRKLPVEGSSAKQDR